MCIGLLKSESWKPSTRASTRALYRSVFINLVLTTVLQLLREPNPDDALVASIGTHVRLSF